eukprot:gene2084-5143_t
MYNLLLGEKEDEEGYKRKMLQILGQISRSTIVNTVTADDTSLYTTTSTGATSNACTDSGTLPQQSDLNTTASSEVATEANEAE